ncbi:peptide-methionine (S)-S-oxide reductase MsrA [Rhodobacter capsulatus]|jgi:peptide-methionine (S)-S-oxide reductase|uniref:Peptide methionine sulfoxide reductase MsrA n=1 Tax=Rhodobacter capsulatus (strain ATCC BAA-309 / NBRC 16581 / SB1003) TaxID=272942 RepID=D5ARV9_RHOCB|nr:peptide-methionine (S)-S-oxide reductase MsrA [Rhodobacter capsulatus]ADE86981.1 peptide-methionine-(S)-S-oxide reductase-1 [Rhodobacter capsulatus SB 1003]ETD00510.1 methionine sulfoxide reductase A [Rhodobacter capsulatus DE442]ETD74850.1 methionine sulfoxide reductase A [Rhodobacter capsulatus R121]ETE52416.1 methionine sulfoxide reductase A [Rhodobacter capsulatus Y262]MDS0928779.1 peptide-methionine (S)-S-oxide reductase MsrA [Rhodobacter capsulatus]
MRRLVLALALALATPAFAEEFRVIPPPAVDAAALTGPETAIFAGGCFWGVQGVFQHLNGVISATSGYAGGTAATAHYDQVSGGETGHAEAVQVVFDPKQISYGDLLQVFFSVAHDPTQLNRQGPDVGPQYRSALFPVTEDQARIAKAYIDQLGRARAFDAAIVTQLDPGAAFYPAEAYHQNFLTLNPDHPYIVQVDMPKIAALERMFPQDWREVPVLLPVAD